MMMPKATAGRSHGGKPPAADRARRGKEERLPRRAADYNAPAYGRGCFPERGTSPQPRRTCRGLPSARPHWRCRANVWRGRTSPAGRLVRLKPHDGSSHMLNLWLGIRRSRQRCAADQRWPVLRPVLREARRSRTGATVTRARFQARRQRRRAAMTSGIAERRRDDWH